MNLIMTFEEFKKFIRDAVKNGDLRLSPNDGTGLSDLDLSIQYALGEMYEEGGENVFTDEDIAEGIIKYCGVKPFENEEEISKSIAKMRGVRVRA